MQPQWLAWAQKLQALAQSGLAYSQNAYDTERYEAIRDIAAEMVAGCTGVDPEFVRQIFGAQVGYATPKVDVRGVIFRDGRVLLVRERQDGLWTLPGGWADVNESPAEATEREVYEESGYSARATRLLALYDRNKHGHPPYLFPIYKLFMQCEITGGAPAQSVETAEVDFFPVDALPELSVTRVTATEIERLYELTEHPDWPADFD